MKVKAIYPGSFDPITNGHLDILERSLNLYSEITILVAGSSTKRALFTPEERVELIREVVKKYPNVKVDSWSGLIMDYAKANQVEVVIRGLRAASDFEHEFMMASMNRELNQKVQTVFMMTSQNLFFVSSSMIKEVHQFGGDVSPYVPDQVARQLREKHPVEKGN